MAQSVAFLALGEPATLALIDMITQHTNKPPVIKDFEVRTGRI